MNDEGIRWRWGEENGGNKKGREEIIIRRKIMEREKKRKKEKKVKGYNRHFIILSTLHSQKKMFCQTIS
jgi:hypothetical protein